MNKSIEEMNLYTRKELAELLEIGHSTLVHHMIWDKKNCPQAIGNKGKTKLYEKQEIIDWYKHRQNWHLYMPSYTYY